MSMSKFASRADYFDAVQAATAAQVARIKPVVTARFITEPELRDSCMIVPVDHPAVYLNGDIAHTSEVVAITADGFETLNTKYVRAV